MLAAPGERSEFTLCVASGSIVAKIVLFVRELVSLGRGGADLASRPPGTDADALAAAVRRRATEQAESARGASADEYAWDDRSLAARRNAADPRARDDAVDA